MHKPETASSKSPRCPAHQHHVWTESCGQIATKGGIGAGHAVGAEGSWARGVEVQKKRKKDRAGQCLKKEIAVKTTHTQPRNNQKHEKEGSEGRSEAGEGEASARLCVGRLCRLGELYTPLIPPPPTPSVTRHDPLATAETATHGSERARWTRGTPIVGPLVFHLGGDYDSNPRSTAPRGVWGYLNSDGYPKRVPLTPGLGFAERPRSILQSITALPHRTPSSNRGVSFKLLELPCPAHVEAMPPRSRQCDPPPLPKMREAVHSHSGKGEGYSSQPFRSLFVVSLLLFASVEEALGCCFYRRVGGEITSTVRTSVVEIFARGRVKRNHAAFSTFLHLHHVVF